MTDNYDFLVIGAGSGGLAAAKQAAQHGAKVAIAEQEAVGGVCVNRGCIPKKLMVYAADFARLMTIATQYGWEVDVRQFNWPHFVNARNEELERLRQAQHDALSKAGIDLIRGHATLKDAHTVAIDDRDITASSILIAVGGKPVKPNIPGIEHTITSREIFHLKQLPKKIAIIGGGYIGVEFASTLHGFGIDVTVLNHDHCILPGFDQDLVNTLDQALRQRGIQIWCNTTADEIKSQPNGLQIIPSGDHTAPFTADVVLCAVGRAARLEGLGLEQAGVDCNKNGIIVDEHNRTTQPHIFAIGDCINRLPLTPVARAEGKAVTDRLFGYQSAPINYDGVPSAVFARPEAATVGKTEADAREQFGDDAIQCHQTTFKPLIYTLDSSANEALSQSLMKFVVHQPSDRVLGFHMVGEHAAEIIQGVSLAIQQGITMQCIKQAIGIHPTSAEELFS